MILVPSKLSPIENKKQEAKSGIVMVLFEVALLGSSIAQKRASKLLQWFNFPREIAYDDLRSYAHG